MNTEIISNKKDTIDYQGQVEVSIVKGNKTIGTRKLYNHGRVNLFKFLANCLAGNYAESLRPVKIKLFYYPSATNPNNKPSDFIWDDACEKLISGSPMIVYDTTPKIQRTAGSDPNIRDGDYFYKTTFHFRIPSSYIVNNTIHAVGFYPNNVTATADCSAYYLFVKDGEWAPIDMADTSENFSIIVDWTMILANKTTNQTTTEIVDTTPEDNSEGASDNTVNTDVGGTEGATTPNGNDATNNVDNTDNTQQIGDNN